MTEQYPDEYWLEDFECRLDGAACLRARKAWG
jgi:hypothetical protein